MRMSAYESLLISVFSVLKRLTSARGSDLQDVPPTPGCSGKRKSAGHAVDIVAFGAPVVFRSRVTIAVLVLRFQIDGLLGIA